MNGRILRRLRHEGGQSLVLVVLSLLGLVAVLALVVDVGMWLHAQRKAQTVADAAALAGAQDLPEPGAAQTARDYAQLNWPGVSTSQSVSPDASEIEVVVESDVPGLFSRLVGILGVTIEAEARASIETPTSVRALTPIALQCERDWSSGCDPWRIGSRRDVDFEWDERDPGDATFHPLALPGITQGNLGSYLSCDIAEPSTSCYAGSVGLGSQPVLDMADARDLRDVLGAAGSSEHLVAVYDDYDRRNRTVNVVGFAVLTITDVGPGQGQGNGPPWVELEGRFSSLLVPGTGVSSDRDEGAPYDFGVHAVALTG